MCSQYKGQGHILARWAPTSYKFGLEPPSMALYMDNWGRNPTNIGFFFNIG